VEALGSRRRDWSSPALLVGGIVVVTAVGAVGGEVGQQSEKALESTPWGRWVLTSVSRASMM